MKNKKHNEDSKVKMMYQLLVSQLEHISLDEFFEFIRQQRQEAYNEGDKAGFKDGYFHAEFIMRDTMDKETIKEKAVQEFAEEIIEIIKNEQSIKSVYTEDNYKSFQFVRACIQKALEVYEGK